MLIAVHTEVTTAPVQAIWGLWEDVAKWNTWDPGITYSTLHGSFLTGTTGSLKPKGGALVRFRLTSVEPIKHFVVEGKLPFTKMIVSHFLQEQSGKTYVTHRFEMKGFLSPLFAILIGRKIKKNLPHDMQAMIQTAEGLR